MADINSPEQLDVMVEEMQDRFGEMPQEVENLFFQLRVKLLAERAGLASVNVESGQLVMRYPQLPEGFPQRNLPVINGSVRSGKNSYWMQLNFEDASWQKDLLQVLNEVIQLTES
jgi:transcription-repair coupling factor (superfamily II helicase)